MVDTVEENRAQGISPRVDARGPGFLLHVTTGKVSGWLEPKLSRAQVCERNRDVTGESRPSLASRSRLSSCLKSPSPSLSPFIPPFLPIFSRYRYSFLFISFLSLSLSFSLRPLLFQLHRIQATRTRQCFLTVACLPFLTIVTFLSIHFEGYSFLSD